MLVDTLKTQIMAAMKARDSVAKDILRLALGELQTAENRAGEAISDEAGFKILTKLVKSNDETLKLTKDETSREKLIRENEILQAILPRLLSVDEIVAVLVDVTAGIKAAPADGPAMGIAMKVLKSGGAAVQSKDVNAAVRQIRAG